MIVLPSQSRFRGSIAIPDSFREGSTTCVVLAVGTKAHPFINTNDRVLVETGFADRKEARIGDTKAFWCEQRHVYALIRNREIFPIGKRILIRRDMADKREHGMGVYGMPMTRRLAAASPHARIARQQRLPADVTPGLWGNLVGVAPATAVFMAAYEPIKQVRSTLKLLDPTLGVL